MLSDLNNLKRSTIIGVSVITYCGILIVVDFMDTAWPLIKLGTCTCYSIYTFKNHFPHLVSNQWNYVSMKNIGPHLFNDSTVTRYTCIVIIALLVPIPFWSVCRTWFAPVPLYDTPLILGLLDLIAVGCIMIYMKSLFLYFHCNQASSMLSLATCK